MMIIYILIFIILKNEKIAFTLNSEKINK